MLKIDDLNVSVEGKEILKNFSLEIPPGEVHAIMGPNGAGKSTLAHVLTGREGYAVSGGGVTFKGQDLLALEPEDRATAGLFLSFQYPLELAGVPTLSFLRTALNAQRKRRGEEAVSAPDFMKRARAAAETLKMPFDMLKRPLNSGFSGGEKKRMEIFQALILQPDFLILDETDSGLDIDALRVVSEGVETLRNEKRGMLVITHYQRLLDYLKPDRVHVMANGRIMESGGADLALKLEDEGYDSYLESAA